MAGNKAFEGAKSTILIKFFIDHLESKLTKKYCAKSIK